MITPDATHPLHQWLGGEWTWTHNADRNMTKLAHAGGLWCDIHGSVLNDPEADEAVWSAMADALHGGVEAGTSGHCVVHFDRKTDGVTAYIDQPLNLPWGNTVVR